MSSNFGVVQFDGKSYCAGLFWYPLEGGPGGARQLEVILAEQQAAFYATRGHPPTQVGLAGDEAPAQRGSLSIAACVANRLTREGLRSFLVAFPTDTPDLWCYVAQNQELIQFDGDMLGSAEAVRERMALHLAAAVDWELVVAPDTWDIAGAVPRERSELLPQGRLTGVWADALSDARLRAVNRRGSGVVDAVSRGALALVLVLLAEAGAGWWVWRSGSQGLEALRDAATAEQQAFIAQRPWLDQPDLARWAPACLAAMARHTRDLAGWNVARIACDPAAARVQVEWLRSSGARFEQLLRLSPRARLAPGGQEPARATAQFAIDPMPPMRLPFARSELPRRADWLREASLWTEQWRERRPVLAAQNAGGGGSAIAWSLTGDLPPPLQLAGLALPGSVLGGIEFNQRDGKPVWTVKATHYVQD